MYLTLRGVLNQVVSKIYERVKATFSSSSPPGAPLPILRAFMTFNLRNVASARPRKKARVRLLAVYTQKSMSCRLHKAFPQLH